MTDDDHTHRVSNTTPEWIEIIVTDGNLREGSELYYEEHELSPWDERRIEVPPKTDIIIKEG